MHTYTHTLKGNKHVSPEANKHKYMNTHNINNQTMTTVLTTTCPPRSKQQQQQQQTHFQPHNLNST